MASATSTRRRLRPCLVKRESTSSSSDASYTTAATSLPSPHPASDGDDERASCKYQHTGKSPAGVPQQQQQQQQQQQRQQQLLLQQTQGSHELHRCASPRNLTLAEGSLAGSIANHQGKLDRDLGRPSPPDHKLRVNGLPTNARVTFKETAPEALAEHTRARQSLDSHASEASQEVTRKRLLPADARARRQRNASSPDVKIAKTLTALPATADRSRTSASAPAGTLLASMSAAVMYRKIWVKRPSASATLVQIKEDDLVDDVREMILKKYANSLGRTFDAPDMTLRIATRADHAGHRTERVLGPEEGMCTTIDFHFPGGQTVDEALVIDVPHKRTPRPSPRHYASYQGMDDLRPQETGTDYFPPMPAVIQPTLPHTTMQAGLRDHHIISLEHPRSISVLNTGQVPPLPSPGGRRHRSERDTRPKYGRQHTSSPTIITHASVAGPTSAAMPNLPSAHLQHRPSNRPRVDSTASEAHHPNAVPAPPPLPTPPAPEAPPSGRAGSTPPTPSGGVPSSAHAHRSARPRKPRKSTPEKLSFRNRGLVSGTDAHGNSNGAPSVSSMLDASVPPINVLIVEDNIINLRILEGLMKRLKVRWQTAMNGQIAVDKWKGGGYHLVLMDIQMPVMNGLQATKEIRRLERVNGIGVFSSSTPGSPNENGGHANGEVKGGKGHDPVDDKLPMADGLFRSPVIIVALTASSLQSDRHEALAAGCNDFLTKPVNFVWLERKVKEWGCMQALIDFDGWRKWKDYAAKEEEGKSDEQRKKEKEQEEKQRIKMEKMAKLQEKQRLRKEEEDKKKKEAAENASKAGTALEPTQEEESVTADS